MRRTAFQDCPRPRPGRRSRRRRRVAHVRRERPRPDTGARVPRPADHPDRSAVRGHRDRRALRDGVRRRARRLLRPLRRPGPDRPGALLHAAARPGGREPRPGDIDFLDVTTLLEPNGQPFATASADPEGLALTKDDELVVTSEGFAARLIDPFVRLFALDGSSLGALPVPTPFLPATGTRGVRRTSASRAPRPRRTAASSSRGRRPRSSRTARRRRSRPAARRASSATTSRPARSTASTSTGSTRSPSRPCPRRTSPSPGSSSCCR